MDRLQELQNKIDKSYKALEYYRVNGMTEQYNIKYQIIAEYLRELEDLINN